MAVTTKQLKRVFRYKGTAIPDPAPTETVERCIEILSVTHPELNNASADVPKIEDGKQVYELKVTVGTKG